LCLIDCGYSGDFWIAIAVGCEAGVGGIEFLDDFAEFEHCG
jgi:hypothetical protein